MADQSVLVSDLSVSPQVLPLETQAATGFTHKAVIKASDINNSAWTGQGDTVTVGLGATPTVWLVDKVAVIISTAFATTGTLTIQVGTDGDPDNFLDAQDAKTAAMLLADTSATIKTEAGSFGVASDNLVARFTTQASTGAPSDITAGEMTILLSIINLGSV